VSQVVPTAFLILAILGLWITAWATARFTSEGIRCLVAGKGRWAVISFTALFLTGQLIRVPGMVTPHGGYGPKYRSLW
jgi:hypothetical protein